MELAFQGSHVIWAELLPMNEGMKRFHGNINQIVLWVRLLQYLLLLRVHHSPFPPAVCSVSSVSLEKEEKENSVRRQIIALSFDGWRS